MFTKLMLQKLSLKQTRHILWDCEGEYNLFCLFKNPVKMRGLASWVEVHSLHNFFCFNGPSFARIFSGGIRLYSRNLFQSCETSNSQRRLAWSLNLETRNEEELLQPSHCMKGICSLNKLVLLIWDGIRILYYAILQPILQPDEIMQAQTATDTWVDTAIMRRFQSTGQGRDTHSVWGPNHRGLMMRGE